MVVCLNENCIIIEYENVLYMTWYSITLYDMMCHTNTMQYFDIYDCIYICNSLHFNFYDKSGLLKVMHCLACSELCNLWLLMSTFKYYIYVTFLPSINDFHYDVCTHNICTFFCPNPTSNWPVWIIDRIIITLVM